MADHVLLSCSSGTIAWPVAVERVSAYCLKFLSPVPVEIVSGLWCQEDGNLRAEGDLPWRSRYSLPRRKIIFRFTGANKPRTPALVIPSRFWWFSSQVYQLDLQLASWVNENNTASRELDNWLSEITDTTKPVCTLYTLLSNSSYFVKHRFLLMKFFAGQCCSSLCAITVCAPRRSSNLRNNRTSRDKSRDVLPLLPQRLPRTIFIAQTRPSSKRGLHRKTTHNANYDCRGRFSLLPEPRYSYRDNRYFSMNWLNVMATRDRCLLWCLRSISDT